MSLEESDAVVRALLYSLSHDLRTPLTAITTIAAALRSSDLDSDLGDRMLADLDEETERLVRLLADLLEAARIEAGAVRPSRVRVPVDELCRAGVDDARTSLDSRLLSRIFEAFRRRHADARARPRGTGLGLARGSLEVHRGGVGVESTVGRGATFVMSLPIR